MKEASNKVTIKKDESILDVTLSKDQLLLKVSKIKKQGQKNPNKQKVPTIFNQIIRRQLFDSKSNANEKQSELANTSYAARYTYEALPNECRLWYENLNQVFDAFLQEKDVEITQLESSYQVRLNVDFTSNGKSYRRICKFCLDFKEEPESIENQNKNENIENNLYTMDQNTAQRNLQTYITNLNEGIHKSSSNPTIYSNTIAQMHKFIHQGFQTMNSRLDNVVKQIAQLQCGQTKLKMKLKQLSQTHNYSLIADNKLSVVRQNYTFSQQCKNENIELLSRTRAICFSKDKAIKYILLNPTSFQIGNKPHLNIFEVELKINKIAKYLSYGICQKNIIKLNRYRNLPQQTKNHGCYVLDWAGQAWSTYLQSQTSQESIKGLRAIKNDIIKIAFKTNRKQLIFYKNGKLKYTMTINPCIPLINLCFVVLMGGQSDQIQIVSMQKKTEIIDLQDSQPDLREKNENGIKKQVIQ